MLQSKVIHRPGFCTVQMGFRSASQNFVMFSSWLKFVYGLDPHAILPLQAAACRHTLSQVMCAQLHAQSQTCPQDLATSVRARRGPTEGISGLAHRSAECCPTSSLASCCPRAPTRPSANRRVNIATSCRGGDANRHQAQSGHTGTTVCFCSLLNTLLSVSIQTEIQM